MLDIVRHFLVCGRADDPVDFPRLAKLEQDPHVLMVALLELVEVDELGVLVPHLPLEYLRRLLQPLLLVLQSELIDPFIAEFCHPPQLNIAQLVDILEDELDFGLFQGLTLELRHGYLLVLELIQKVEQWYELSASPLRDIGVQDWHVAIRHVLRSVRVSDLLDQCLFHGLVNVDRVDVVELADGRIPEDDHA